MLNITIQNGTLIVNGDKVDIKNCQLGKKVTEVFGYFIRNNINLQLTKYAQYISYNTDRVDASKRLMAALEQDDLIRPNKLLKEPS